MEAHLDATAHWSDLLHPVRRWTAGRKAALIDGIRAGHLDEERMLALHNISEEEFESWVIKRVEGGEPALRSTKLQAYPAVRT